MKAMVLEKIGQPLCLKNVPIPEPGSGQLLLKVLACAVCRTDLHIFDGELTDPKLPLILGHQIVGTVEKIGPGNAAFQIGERVGVPWLQGSCKACPYCLSGRENLCENAIFTGYRVNGGFAEYCVANAAYCFPIPESYDSAHAAPLLCGGLIGYRALKKAGNAKRIGFYGFGSSAHILTQVALFQKRQVYAFTRTGDSKAQKLALELGTAWAGSSEEKPPELLDAAIIFAPSGPLVPKALASLNKGGTVICAGIHMSDIPSFSYNLLWEERSIQSVANLTHQDGVDLFSLARQMTFQTTITKYPLENANQALEDLKHGKFVGSAVIVIHH